MAVETLQLQFESLICKQELAQLVDICKYLKIEESVDDKTALQIVKIIRNFVEKVVASPGDIDVEVFLGDAVAYVTGSAPPLEKSEDEKKVTDLENKLRLLKLQQESQVKELLRELKDVQSKVSENSVMSNVVDNTAKVASSISDPTPFLCREFKITGQIGQGRLIS